MKVVRYTKTTYELMTYDEFRERFEIGGKIKLPNGCTYDVVHVDTFRATRTTYGDGPLIAGWWAGSITLREERRGDHVELIIERGNIYWTIEERSEEEVEFHG